MINEPLEEAAARPDLPVYPPTHSTDLGLKSIEAVQLKTDPEIVELYFMIADRHVSVMLELLFSMKNVT